MGWLIRIPEALVLAWGYASLLLNPDPRERETRGWKDVVGCMAYSLVVIAVLAVAVMIGVPR